VVPRSSCGEILSFFFKKWRKKGLQTVSFFWFSEKLVRIFQKMKTLPVLHVIFPFKIFNKRYLNFDSYFAEIR
jgi:hypothetical protein